MKKIVLVGIALGFVALVWFGYVKRLSPEATARAQNLDVDTEYQKLIERDKNVPREKIDKAYAEAKKSVMGLLPSSPRKNPNTKCPEESPDI